jgi:hypothetical protein
MGLFRKAVRRATPRPVRKVKRVVRHPVRTGVRAATPKPIRDAERAAFKLAHPVNTAENAFLDAVTPRPGPPRPKHQALPERPPAPRTPLRSTGTRSRRSALLPVIVALSMLAAGGLGLLLGQAGGVNLSASRSAGARAGQQEGQRVGYARGYASGYSSAKTTARTKAYAASYKVAYQKALGR